MFAILNEPDYKQAATHAGQKRGANKRAGSIGYLCHQPLTNKTVPNGGGLVARNEQQWW